MVVGYKRIFWGIFIATFSITIGKVTIVPSFIGWIVVLAGLLVLEDHFHKASLFVPRISTIILIVASIGEWLFPLLINNVAGFFPLLLYQLVVIIIELVVFHKIITASYDNLNATGQLEAADKYINKDRTYMMLMGISLLLLVISFTLNHYVTGFMGIIMVIISRIYLLTVINSISNEDYQTDENDKSYADENNLQTQQ